MEHYVDKSRKKADYSAVCAIGIDEISIRKGHQYVSIVADSSNARSIFVCEGKNAAVFESFAKDLEAHGGSPEFACINWQFPGICS